MNYVNMMLQVVRVRSQCYSRRVIEGDDGAARRLANLAFQGSDGDLSPRLWPASGERGGGGGNGGSPPSPLRGASTPDAAVSNLVPASESNPAVASGDHFFLQNIA